ncbi:hypothetical protein CKAH01_00774 [Colletotrichum kahawae]|uniref:Uncharacterized protein n=1 Tax=Colletotrichum kahawae TaxID=34407 RepID=A0AAD9YJZ9_COLKA|nr:hypothetical protein CKAH01_00774 [Colletotrichum kahawae]
MFPNDFKHDKSLDGATLCSTDDSVRGEATKDCQNDEHKRNPRREDDSKSAGTRLHSISQTLTGEENSSLTGDVADLRQGLLVHEEPERRRRRLREREKDEKVEGGILALVGIPSQYILSFIADICV